MEPALVKVVVNGKSYDLAHGRRLSYVHAVRLAYNHADEDTLPEGLTVTFRYKKGRNGILHFGGPSIPAAAGMVINVANTSSS